MHGRKHLRLRQITVTTCKSLATKEALSNVHGILVSLKWLFDVGLAVADPAA
jgi:hypothetical protein